VKHSTSVLSRTKIVKGFENIFIKLLARKKRLCIFALGFRNTPTKTIQQLNKVFKDTKQ
jgi:hypothetical protein